MKYNCPSKANPGKKRWSKGLQLDKNLCLCRNPVMRYLRSQSIGKQREEGMIVVINEEDLELEAAGLKVIGKHMFKTRLAEGTCYIFTKFYG